MGNNMEENKTSLIHLRFDIIKSITSLNIVCNKDPSRKKMTRNNLANSKGDLLFLELMHVIQKVVGSQFLIFVTSEVHLQYDCTIKTHCFKLGLNTTLQNKEITEELVNPWCSSETAWVYLKILTEKGIDSILKQYP